MDRIRAPYNFVPLSPRVVFPDWADVPAQEVPFDDGLCGTLNIEVRTHTPVFVRGRPGDAFFSLGGVPAIPGSELRGLLRNVVEIASFGKLGRYNDHRYGVRDLHNRDLYVGHMADLRLAPGGDRKQPMPLVDAGWLRRVDDGRGDIVAEITPCDFAKIHYRDLSDLARRRGARAFDPGRKQSAPEKYRAWGAEHGEEDKRRIEAEVLTLRPADGSFQSLYGKARPGGRRPGLLVFTGQPQRWEANDPRNRSKRNDFVFFEPAERARPISVSKRTFEDFQFVHADRGQQGRLVEGRLAPNEEWGFWRGVFDEGGRVPVFYLRWPRDGASSKAGTLRAFGLAMMFRLAYDHSVAHGVHNAQPLANALRLDLADLIFGNVLKDKDDDDPNKTVARRGRVSFSLFRPVGEVVLGSPVHDLVLGPPKASYYPNYLEQGPGAGDAPRNENDRPRYKTFMDADVRVRGWKRYRPHEAVRVARRPTKGDGSEMDLSRVATRFTPLRAGTAFQGVLRVHNLRRVEVGALLWALDFGGREDCFHTLGLGRSYGYGRVQLRVVGMDLDATAGGAVDLQMCRDAFAKYMGEQLCDMPGAWEGSVQIADLVALARPVPEASDEGRHMELRHPQHGNEFQEAKKGGFALAPVGRPQARAGQARGGGPRTAEPATRGAPAVARPTPAQSTTSSSEGAPQRGWAGLRAGSKVKARLVGLSRKGKWQVELVEHAARGVVGAGDPPAGAEVGSVFEVIVTGGGDPTNLVLRWP